MSAICERSCGKGKTAFEGPMLSSPGPGRLPRPRCAEPTRCYTSRSARPILRNHGGRSEVTWQELLNQYQKETHDETDAFGDVWRDGDPCGNGSRCGLGR